MDIDLHSHHDFDELRFSPTVKAGLYVSKEKEQTSYQI